MNEEIDIYGHRALLDQAVRRTKKIDTSDRNIELILKFKDFCLLQRMSRGRIIRYLNVLKHTSVALGKDFDQANKQDIERLVGMIHDRNLAVATIKLYKIMIKRFYKWLKGNDEEYPVEVKWIKSTLKRSEEKLPSEGDMITEEEVRGLIDAAKNSRDKAFISLLYESGCRVGEIATLRIGHIVFDNYGMVISVKGKTGSRKVRLVFSVPYLTNWLQNHAYSKDRESPLWIGVGTRNNKDVLTYTSLRRILLNCFIKAGIKKMTNPHFLRHSRATFMANHLTEFQMNQYFGWIQGSKMPSIYVHLSGKETDKAILELNGINMPKELKESTLKPQKCPRCDTINGHGDKYCSRCAGPLNIQTTIALEDKRREESETRKSADGMMNMLMQDEEFRNMLMKKVSQLGLKNGN